jgi:hypothetical protein
MTRDEMTAKAVERVSADNPQGTNFKAYKVYESILDGTLVTVNFEQPARKDDSNQVHFGREGIRVFRWHSEVIDAISKAKERNPFFRLIELVGIGGVIAFILVLIFSILLCGLAIGNQNSATILEVVKMSFTIILGYFFGSQAAKGKGDH